MMRASWGSEKRWVSIPGCLVGLWTALPLSGCPLNAGPWHEWPDERGQLKSLNCKRRSPNKQAAYLSHLRYFHKVYARMHLLLPFLASILFVGGLICLKRVGESGVSPVTVLFASNLAAALIFPALWFLGGQVRPWGFWWQPLVIAILYMMGLLFTFAAINRGDVSVATPVLGVKVLFVTILLAVTRISEPSTTIWYAASMATLGIALIQYTGTGRPRRILLTILLAICAASSYATFDVLVQRWAPAWGAGRFLPVVFAMVGILSAPMIPWTQWKPVKADRRVAALLVLGAILIALQAVCIVSTLSIFGDAARVNVVYGLRGLWSVVLAWMVARVWGGAESQLSQRELATRFAGAGLLTAAVVAVVLDS